MFGGNNKEIKKAYTKYNSLRDDYSELYKKNLELDSENKSLTSSNMKLNDELIEAKTEIKKITSKFIYTETELFEKETELKKLKIKLETDNMSLSNEIDKLKSKLDIKEDEIAYKNKLITELRELPDIANIIKNLQQLSIPGLDELKQFAEIVKADNLHEPLADIISIKLERNNEKLIPLIAEVIHHHRYNRGY